MNLFSTVHSPESFCKKCTAKQVESFFINNACFRIQRWSESEIDLKSGKEEKTDGEYWSLTISYSNVTSSPRAIRKYFLELFFHCNLSTDLGLSTVKSRVLLYIVLCFPTFYASVPYASIIHVNLFLSTGFIIYIQTAHGKRAHC